MLLYALTTFLSAFLLSQVQPVIAKIILPWFGGSSAVWTTCMLFFQSTLFLGYVYAHWLNRKLAGQRQAMLHTVILAASLAALPILPNAHWKSVAMGNPSWRILALLSLTIGAPYFLLSSTSPLLQAWYARTQKKAMPYRLFALSNLASMLALLSYPALVEPKLTASAQAGIWSAAYVVFTILCAICAWRAGPGEAATTTRGTAPSWTDRLTAPSWTDRLTAPSWTDRLIWIGFAACASILLLSVTTFLTQDVAAI